MPKAKYKAKELELGKTLVGYLRAPLKPEQFHDAYKENVGRLIKQKGQKITSVEQPHKSSVIDLREALKRNLDVGKPGSVPGRPARDSRQGRLTFVARSLFKEGCDFFPRLTG